MDIEKEVVETRPGVFEKLVSFFTFSVEDYTGNPGGFFLFGELVHRLEIGLDDFGKGIIGIFVKGHPEEQLMGRIPFGLKGRRRSREPVAGVKSLPAISRGIGGKSEQR